MAGAAQLGTTAADADRDGARSAALDRCLEGETEVVGVEELLRSLVECGGSDLHVKAGSVPHVRIAGELSPAPFEPHTPADLERLAREVLSEEAAALLQRCGEVDVAYSIGGVGRFRVSAYRQRGSLALAIRRVVPGVPSMEALGLPAVVGRLADEPRGLLLVVGPGSSGRSTTAAAIVDHINRTRPAHIVTIEDPIEVLHSDQHSMVSQREVGTDVEGFAEGIKNARRLDPDVLFVSDIGDSVSAHEVLAVAAAGRLVIATLGVVGAAAALDRLVGLFSPREHEQARESLAGVLRGVVAQRLVDRSDGQGRVAAIEVLVATNKVAAAIRSGADTSTLRALMREGEYHGMQTHDQALMALYRSGVVSLWDAMSHADDAEGLRIELEHAPTTPSSDAGTLASA
jgi:twitching motility protein PilT